MLCTSALRHRSAVGLDHVCFQRHKCLPAVNYTQRHRQLNLLNRVCMEQGTSSAQVLSEGKAGSHVSRTLDQRQCCQAAEAESSNI